MKARNRKTPWLLITLALGVLSAAGVIFVLHPHPGRLLVSSSGIAPPNDTPTQEIAATASGSIGDEPTAEIFTGVRGDDYVATRTYSNSTRTDADNDSSAPSTLSGRVASGGTSQPSGTTGPSGGTQPQVTHPSSSGDITAPPQAVGTGEFAGAGNIPFGCGLPASCGGGGAQMIQSSGTSGGTPTLHNSQGPTQQTADSDPQTDNSSQPPDDSDPTGQGNGNLGQKSDPSSPGPGPSVAAAPEFDPATLAAALTLLFGSLAIVRSRQVRASIR